MFSHTTAHEPFRATTTVAWSEVVVGDRRRPVKIVGLPAFGRPAEPHPRHVASNGATRSQDQRKEA